MTEDRAIPTPIVVEVLYKMVDGNHTPVVVITHHDVVITSSGSGSGGRRGEEAVVEGEDKGVEEACSHGLLS